MLIGSKYGRNTKCFFLLWSSHSRFSFSYSYLLVSPADVFENPFNSLSISFFLEAKSSKRGPYS